MLSRNFKRPLYAAIAATLVGAISTDLYAATYTFLPTSNASFNWNDNATWNDIADAGFPGVAGDVAQRTSSTSSSTATQNVVGGVTVGRISSQGTTANTWTMQLDNAITFNEDGNGAGSATINRSGSNVGARIDFAGAGGLVLGDNLSITNVGGTSASGSIALRTLISGTGNIVINNDQNATANGQVRFEPGGNNNFIGSTTAASGAVTFNQVRAFGDAANTINLGVNGGGAATLVTSNAPGTVPYAINIASGSGALLLGSTSAAATGNGTTYSGPIAMNGDLTITSSNTGSAAVTFSNAISGTGNLTVVGTGVTRFSGANTYTGNTTVADGATLTLTSSSIERFKLQDGSVSNRIDGGATGTGVATFGGFLYIDVSSVTQTSGTWNLVNVSNLGETFTPATFGVALVGGPNFTNNGGGVYTSGDWTFRTSDGNLSIPEPHTLCLLAPLAFGRCRRRRVVE